MSSETAVNSQGQGQPRVFGRIPLVFLQESELFGNRKPTQAEWLSHTELYQAISTHINATHIEGLQRVRGMWRIYLDNIDDKVILMSEWVPLRGKILPVLYTNPDRLDSEQSTRVRIKNVPLSVDDGIITRSLTLKHVEVLVCQREKLRINGKLTNCATGDRLVLDKSSTLLEPLPYTMNFGHFVGRVIHQGQTNTKPSRSIMKCSRCHEDGHKFSQCTNEWVCNGCKQSGHKQTDCPFNNTEGRNSADKMDVDPRDSADESSSDNESIGSTDTTPKQKSTERTRSRAHAEPPKATPSSSQASMDRFVTKTSLETPSKSRASSVHRSPPTPVDILEERVNDGKKNKKTH